MKLHDLADVSITGEGTLPDDILLQRVGTGGTVGRPFMGDDTTAPLNTITVRLTKHGKTLVIPKYLYYMLTALHMQGFFRRLAVGSVQRAIRVPDIQNLWVVT